MRADTSPLELADGLVSVEVVAPVVLVELLVAPIVLEVDARGDVLLSVDTEGYASLPGEVLVELLELGLEVLLYVELVPADDVAGSAELVELGLVELVL